MVENNGLFGIPFYEEGRPIAEVVCELLGKKSIPRNPLLFGMLYRMNRVEHVGSGIKRIREICREYRTEEPQIDVDEHWVTVRFFRPNLKNGIRVEKIAMPIGEQVGEQVKAMLFSCGERARDKNELLDAAGLSRAYLSYKRHIIPLLEAGLIEMTLPEKPTSRYQKYRLTAPGKVLLERIKN